MYESLTSFIPVLATDSYGEWIVDKENDGTPIVVPMSRTKKRGKRV